MENYLEYLEKLKGKMNLDEVVDKNKVIEYRKLYDKYNGLSIMFGFIGSAVALSMVFVAHYSRIGAMVVMLVAFSFYISYRSMVIKLTVTENYHETNVTKFTMQIIL